MAVSRINEAGLNVNQYGNRNVIYNGAMKVAQRGTSATGITSSGYNTVDRWRVSNGAAGTWTMAQTAVTDLPGFRYSLKMDCTTADASLAATDDLAIQQRFEGQDLQQFQKGTSSAKEWTMSFYVKGTTTGTYICQLFDNDNNRFVSKSYTIDTANTWEYKTITFPADTTGTLNNASGNNLIVYWYLAAGSNFTSGTLQTTWGTNTNANKAVGQVNLAASTSNDWQITGVQLEVGDTATDFEHRTFGDELARCERYFYKTYEYATKPGTASSLASSLGRYLDATQNYASLPLPTLNLRATPTTTIYNPNDGTVGEIRSDSTDHPAVGHSSIGQRGGAFIYANNSSINQSGSSRAHITFDAEL